MFFGDLQGVTQGSSKAGSSCRHKTTKHDKSARTCRVVLWGDFARIPESGYHEEAPASPRILRVFFPQQCAYYQHFTFENHATGSICSRRTLAGNQQTSD